MISSFFCVGAINRAARTVSTSLWPSFRSNSGGVAALIGQRLDALGPIHTYKYRHGGSVGEHVPAAILSSFQSSRFA